MPSILTGLAIARTQYLFQGDWRTCIGLTGAASCNRATLDFIWTLHFLPRNAAFLCRRQLRASEECAALR